ncbi:MAG: hypothetical protein NUW01_18655 [Gemmatimonadaceae bacterium]|nr:hypothetical protein [Gemmatimonadaceae bacterium]
MSLDSLTTLVDQQKVRRATPKHEMTTRLSEKGAAIADEKKQEAAWKKGVWKRDDGKCRVCHCHVKKTLTFEPKQGHCHHIKERAHKPTRWDVRNGLLVCMEDHERIEHNKLIPLQAAKHLFTVGTTQYLNGSQPMQFKEAK